MTGDITMSGDAKFVGNLTGNADTATSADSATNDSAGQQIDSTYVKNVESTDDGKLIVTKGNGDTSTADVSTPAGYNLVKTIPFAPSNDNYWLHIGDIKNTADNDVIRLTVKQEAHNMTIYEDSQNTVKANIVLHREFIINDMVQKTDTDLSSSYTCRGIAYQIFDANATSLLASPAEENELEQASFIVVPTSGGNKTSCASVWTYIGDTHHTQPDTAVSMTISAEVTDKNLWEYVLTYEASAPKSDSIITPFTEKKIITETDIASVSEAGIVKIGNNINVEQDGTISVPEASTTVPGVVKIGTGINVADDGTISVPKASTTVPGVVIVGNGLKISDEGVLSSDVTLPEVDKLTAYPVGSIYMSTDAASPAALFGGAWEQIASDRVLMGASSTHAAGTTVKAGLPNITGSTGRFASGYSSSPDRKNGALSYSENSSWMGYYSSSGSAGYGYYIDFNASSSNAIYGRSSTVQPAAYYVHIWRRTA